MYRYLWPYLLKKLFLTRNDSIIIPQLPLLDQRHPQKYFKQFLPHQHIISIPLIQIHIHHPRIRCTDIIIYRIKGQIKYIDSQLLIQQTHRVDHRLEYLLFDLEWDVIAPGVIDCHEPDVHVCEVFLVDLD